MRYDFIEIGTSDFDTMIQIANENTIGISVEPIKYYLDRLPNPRGVKKLNCAISLDGKHGREKVYYIPDNVIQENNLPTWIRGCNSMGDYHYQHKHRKLQHLVVTEEVDTIPIADLLENNEVGEINVLKIDTEGGDCYILQSFLPVLKNRPKPFWPRHIQFESNILTEEAVIDETITLYTDIGYRMIRRGEENTLLSL